MALRLAGLLLAAIALAPGQTATSLAETSLAERIDQLIDRPAARRAFWGLRIVNLADGEVLYARDSEKLFVPASNTKLFATALALESLGPDARMTTELVGEAALGPDGVLPGPLRLIGGGDPNLSSRVAPYRGEEEFREDRLEPMRTLAQQAYDAGLRKVEGDVIGDDRRYVWAPYPEGWSIGDEIWSYGAPVSALSFNDNTIKILVRPGAIAGQPARLKIDPSFDYFAIRNETRTAPTRIVAKRLSLGMNPVDRAVDLWGEISIRSPGRDMSIAVDDPALFAATALKRALEDAGVEITGQARADHLRPLDVPDLKGGDPPASREYPLRLGRLDSAPLDDLITITNKESQNLHAEMLLREVGFARRGVGSLEAAIEEMRTFLRGAGLSPWEFFLNDGSGLSRQNLVSPSGAVKLLRHMWDSPNRAAFVSSLSIAGEDGTLDWRFSRTVAKGRIHAKTGTLSHVTALSGYAQAIDGRDLAFSIYVNNFGVSTSYIRDIVDRVMLAVITSEPERVQATEGAE